MKKIKCLCMVIILICLSMNMFILANAKSNNVIELNDIIIHEKKDAYAYGDRVAISCKITSNCEINRCLVIFNMYSDMGFEFDLFYNSKTGRYEGISEPLGASLVEGTYPIYVIAFEEYGNSLAESDSFRGSISNGYYITINDNCAKGNHTFEYSYWQTVVEATTTRDGYMVRDCDECTAVVKKILPRIVRKTKSITGVQSSITLKPGGTATIKPVITPSNTTDKLVYVSSDSSIASITSQGKVNAHKAGKCTITVRSGDMKRTINVTVKKSNPYLNKTKVSLFVKEKYTLKLWCATSTVKWSSSNKKIATVNSKGVVTAKKAGTCTIKAKCGKKTYKAKITVKRDEPNFGATVFWYDTRGNYFEVIFHNYSKKPLTIYSSGAKMVDEDYKSFDRNVKLYKNKNVTLKAGQKRVLKFYVKGKTTWYDADDFTLKYTFKFDGKKYKGEVDSCDTAYKNGSKWYNTYSASKADDWYDEIWD